jgi:hypothetical protein
MRAAARENRGGSGLSQNRGRRWLWPGVLAWPRWIRKWPGGPWASQTRGALQKWAKPDNTFPI